MKRYTILTATLVVSMLAGCSQVQTSGGSPYPPVPDALAESIPKPPVTAEALMWQPGHWDWNGSGYIWAPGQYVPAAGHGSLWMPGWWSRTESTWAWQPPHWTS